MLALRSAMLSVNSTFIHNHYTTSLLLVSACRKHRNICSYRLTTCYGLHQKTSFVSIRAPHSSAHSGDSSTQRPTLPSWPSIRSFTRQGLETSSWSSSRALDRQTNSAMTLDLFLPTSGETGHPTVPCGGTRRPVYAMTTTTTTILLPVAARTDTFLHR